MTESLKSHSEVVLFAAGCFCLWESGGGNGGFQCGENSPSGCGGADCGISPRLN